MTVALNPIKKSYFPKPPKRKYSFDGYTNGEVMPQSEPRSKQIVPRIFLAVFATGLIVYVLTHGGVRINVEVDLSNWKEGTHQLDTVAKDAQMNVLAAALMHELTRQGVFPESVEVDNSTISITAPKAPITGTRLADMIDNIKDCHVGAFEWEGTSVDIDMLRSTTACETVFSTCNTSVDSNGQIQLNVALTSDGRNHFEDFHDTMVFVKAAYPIAMIYDYRLDDSGNIVIRSSNKSPQTQQRELSRICDAIQNRDRLEGVTFKSISTHRIGPRLLNFQIFPGLNQ
ncbi:MAG: hypothetical protein JXR76_28895 [Deltaproteobacteria bacterium]|nr:hypothetical protein [Deltaproteobacteria bacterium]